MTKSAAISEAVMPTCEKFFAQIHRFITMNLEAKMELLECNYIKQLTDLLDGLMLDVDEKELTRAYLEKLIVFAGMWSLGAALEIADRQKVEAVMRELEELPLPPCSEEETMFEYVVGPKGVWEHWSTRVPEYIYPKDRTPDYTQILVPNVDNTRTDFLIHAIARQTKPGTAKTVMVKGYCRKYDPEEHMFKAVNFSSATTPNMFQRTMESYIDKRVGSTYGPPAGKKMTVFIDDINMPLINEWGDQITNEITRQMMEMSGFYNLDKPGDFTTIVDIQVD
ncbi:unnamed protein product [Dibothriocephalus latus]|uniref:Dynein heavy chain AAA 5 extension domain-containing protein n=1 Tax=Dibothriocephalus latus TaxID=60516 RepID=A0A3P6P6U1_DIBLA|nr:unnamed protein product [Dibothriocephalus latus]